MKKSFSVLSSLFILSISVSATTYYASPKGSGDGSSYAKTCSFSTGIGKLKNAGDTLYLLGGQYDLGNTKISSKNGNSNSYIVIAGYPGEQAILDFRTTPYARIADCELLYLPAYQRFDIALLRQEQPVQRGQSLHFRALGHLRFFRHRMPDEERRQQPHQECGFT